MSVLDVIVALFIGLAAILLFYRTRRLKAHSAVFESQRVRPACGFITSRLEPCCVERGKVLPAIVV